MGRPLGSQNKDKPFRDALRQEAFGDWNDADPPRVGKRSLRAVARALLSKGADGDVGAAKEIGDRLDGKVPQAVVGDAEHDPIRAIVTGVVRAHDQD